MAETGCLPTTIRYERRIAAVLSNSIGFTAQHSLRIQKAAEQRLSLSLSLSLNFISFHFVVEYIGASVRACRSVFIRPTHTHTHTQYIYRVVLLVENCMRKIYRKRGRDRVQLMASMTCVNLIHEFFHLIIILFFFFYLSLI